MTRNWVVAISTDDNEPHIFGPYTEPTARRLAAEFNDRVNMDEYGWILASAWPIQNPRSVRPMLREFGQVV